MKKIQVNIAKSFLSNVLFSIFLTVIILIIIFRTSNGYIENNPLNQYGAIYNVGNVGVYYELSNVRELISHYPYPNSFEMLLIQLKIILSFRFDINIAFIIFAICLSLIYLIKYVKIKIVE